MEQKSCNHCVKILKGYTVKLQNVEHPKLGKSQVYMKSTPIKDIAHLTLAP